MYFEVGYNLLECGVCNSKSPSGDAAAAGGGYVFDFLGRVYLHFPRRQEERKKLEW